MTSAAPQTGYAPVDGLNMYYELHGTGKPLVVLHGAFMSTTSMSGLITSLAQTRQVIAVDAQGHGRTADRADRPLTFEQMADDVAALLGALKIPQADILGYSMGATTALEVAVRHPQVVDKLVILSAPFMPSGWRAGVLTAIASLTPELFVGSPIEADYQRFAPHPEDFPALVTKIVQLDKASNSGVSAATIQAITAPTLTIIGDSDGIDLNHVVDMFRLLGGDINADFRPLPKSQLAIIPGARHTDILTRLELLTPMIINFLDTPPAPAS